MSAVDRLRTGRVRAARASAERARTLTVRVLFGDRLGLALFLGSLCFVGAYWRIGFFINDSVTLANGLVALSEGRLWVEEATYLTLETPGMHILDETVYARNYGQIALSLLVLWVLQAMATLVDPALGLVALWCLCLLGLCLAVGRLLGRESVAALVGSAVTLSVFLASVLVARPVDPLQLPIAALQLTTALVAAITAVSLYRLLARMYGPRTGLAAGVVLVTATPIGFWATIPKRHVFGACVAVGMVYALYRSRDHDTDSGSLLSPLGFRALAYALGGLFTWIHLVEGLLFLTALVAVDLPTARSNDWRTLAVLGLALSASMLPTVVTNTLISGNPLRAPRLLPNIEHNYVGYDIPSTSSGGGGGGGGSVSIIQFVPAPVFDLVTYASVYLGLFVEGIQRIVRDVNVLNQMFVRGGFIEAVSRENEHQTVYLTVLESTPILAGIGAAVAATASGVLVDGRRRRVPAVRRPGEWSAKRVADIFAGLVAVVFVVIYAPELPNNAQITVRYLLPLYPLGVYAMASQSPVRRLLGRRGRLALWTWFVCVCIGVQVLLVAVAVRNLSLGGTFQFHATLHLGVAAMLATLASLTAVTDRLDSLAAVAFGLAAAMGTNFLLLTGLVYLQYGQYALPVVDAVTDLLSVV